MQPPENDLLDMIYETAYAPSLWSRVLERLADAVGGGGGWVSQLNVDDGKGGSLDDPMCRVDPVWAQRFIDYYAALNPLNNVDDSRAHFRQWQPIVLTDEDWIDKDVLMRTEYYNDFLLPQDLHSTLWIRLEARESDAATINLSGTRRRGRFDQKDIDLARAYQPHLIRAFKMAKRLGTDRRQHADVEALLDLSPNGFFLLDGNGTLRHTNNAGEKLLAEAGVFNVVHGKLRAGQASVSKQLEALIAIAASPDAEARRGGSMAIPSPKSALPLAVLVTPIGGHKFASIKSGLSVCVCVTDLSAEMQLPRGPLQNVFSLTDAEIRVAQSLFEGASLQEIAARFGISLNTVRVQLGSVFEKTHTNRQVDLIAMLSRLSHIRAS